MNALQVKFDCGEGNKGGRFLECIWLTTAYLSTKLEGSGEVETSILELESIWAGTAGPSQTKPGVHEGHVIGRIRDQSEEGGEAAHQPEHGIWPGPPEEHGLTTIAPRSTGEVVTNVERAGSAGIDKEHQILVAQIRRVHVVSTCSVSHAPPLLRKGDYSNSE